MIKIEILLTFVYFLECTVVQCKIEIGTAMNARESENYLPISRSFSAIKIVSRSFKPRYIGEDFLRAEIYRGRLLTLITGSSSRLLCIRFSADLIMYWFPVCHFRCKEFKLLVIWKTLLFLP